MSEDRKDDLWDQLAAGDLSREDEAVLRALAEGEDGESPEYEAFRPLDDAARERITDDLVEQVHAGQRERFGAARARRLAAWPAAAGLAAAAAALLVFWPAGEDPVLTAYHLELSGGVQQQRSATEAPEVPTFDEASEVTLVLRPVASAPSTGEVAAYLVREGEIRRWEVDFQVASTGAMRLRGPASELLPRGEGRWTVAVVHAARLPDEATQREWIKQRAPQVLFADFMRAADAP